MTKTTQVVMLPTENNTKIFYHILSGKIGWTEVELKLRNARISQHLYFISNDEIKEGDIELNEWYIHKTFGSKFLYQATVTDIKNWKNGHIYGNKVLASTDPNLGLPLIPQQWVRDIFVLSNGSIKKVELEEELWPNAGGMSERLELKLTPNNEVVISGFEGKYDHNIHHGEVLPDSIITNAPSNEDPQKLDAIKGIKGAKKSLLSLYDKPLFPMPITPPHIMSYNRDAFTLAEKVTINQELDEAAQNYVDTYPDTEAVKTYTIARNGFKAGAAWQYEQFKLDNENPNLDDVSKKRSELEFPYDDFRGKDIGLNDEKTGMALRGAFCGGFEQGVAYQKEQSKNEVIKLLDWIVENGWSISNPMWINGEASSDCDSGKSTYTELFSKGLYELWKENK